MGSTSHPRRGSMQFWPRKRSRHSLVRIRSWAKETKAKPLGFIGYKVGMTHIMANDTRPKSPTKGEKLSLPTTIIECPPMKIIGLSFYQKHGTGQRKFASFLAPTLDKNLAKIFPLPKKELKPLSEIKEFSDLRLLVYSNPKQTSTGSKKAKLLEIAMGGSSDEKLTSAKELLGKEITIEDVFEAGAFTDLHGISKGKGFQGAVKRYGVPIMQHKAEKKKRGIANLGAWTPKRVDYRVPQPGKMGYHQRTEYNKQILKISPNTDEINPKSGHNHYGLVKNPYLLVKGSIIGPTKKAIVLTKAIRPTKRSKREVPQITLIA